MLAIVPRTRAAWRTHTPRFDYARERNAKREAKQHQRHCEYWSTEMIIVFERSQVYSNALSARIPDAPSWRTRMKHFTLRDLSAGLSAAVLNLMLVDAPRPDWRSHDSSSHREPRKTHVSNRIAYRISRRCKQWRTTSADQEYENTRLIDILRVDQCVETIAHR